MSRTRITIAALVVVTMVTAVAIALVSSRREDEGPAAGPVPVSDERSTSGTDTSRAPDGSTLEPAPAPADPPASSTNPTPTNAGGSSSGRTRSTPSGAAGGGGGGAPGAPSTKDRLAGVSTWAFALGADLAQPPASVAARFGGYDLVVIDGADASPDVVAALRAQGSIVLGYLSVGTVEKNRSWSAAAAPYLLDHWGEWDETYADTSKAGFRSLITDTVAPPIMAKGFDGLFLDNTDMVEEHSAQGPGMAQLVAALSQQVHQRGGLLFAQNGDSSVDAIVDHLDGWNREDVSSTSTGSGGYELQSDGDRAAAVATIRRLRARGLLVTAVDYFAQASSPAVDAARRTACAAGAIPYASDRGLQRVPSTPPRC